MKKINIKPSGVSLSNNLDYDLLGNYYIGGRNIFLPFENCNKGLKTFLRNGDDPHRLIDQPFRDPPFHYDNPDQEVVPLNRGEFNLIRDLHEVFEKIGIGPKIYETLEVRVNSTNHFALVTENLSRFPNPSERETLDKRDQINELLQDINLFNMHWSDEEPSNYFKTEDRGILSVDLDWGLFVHNKVNKDKLDEFRIGLNEEALNREIPDKQVNISEIEEGPKFMFCTVAIGRHATFQTYIKDNFESYCDKHGYEFLCLDRQIDIDFENNAYQKTNCGTLYKIRAIEKALKSDCDYVAIMDAFDALITNKSRPLEDFINEDDSIFFSTDIKTWDLDKAKETDSINTGFAIYKNNDFTRSFLERVKSYPVEWNEEQRNRVNDQVLVRHVMEENPDLYENIALGDPLQQSYWFFRKPNFKRDHEFLYNQHNSPWLWEEGDFMIHFPGQPASRYLIEEFHEYTSS